ncbi:MAG: hydrogenase maturation protease [Acidimicrobiia bacterium]|jgi:hydrogenase maturation protease
MSHNYDAIGSGAGHGSRRGEDHLCCVAPSVVVGLGNEIAGDDGVGIHVARILEPRMKDVPGVDVVALPWAGLALLDVLRGRARVAIVDCLTSGNHPPGTIVRLDEQGIAGSVRLNSFHDISFPTAMALGRQMGWEMPDTVAIWGVEAERVGVFHEGLSPAVAAAVEPLIRDLTLFIDPVENRLEPMGVMR